MMTQLTPVLRRADARGHTRTDWLDSAHTFSFGEYYDPDNRGWGTLRVINDDIVKPASGFGTHGHKDMEIITWVLSGTLEHQDSLGNGALIRPGEIQRMSAGAGIQHGEWNPSETEPVHLLQIWIRPAMAGGPPGYEQNQVIQGEVTPKEGRHQWVAVASQAGGKHQVSLRQDATVYWGLPEGETLMRHSFRKNRVGWLHVIAGPIQVGDLTLQAGDGLGLKGETELVSVFSPESEALLFDVPAA